MKKTIAIIIIVVAMVLMIFQVALEYISFEIYHINRKKCACDYLTHEVEELRNITDYLNSSLKDLRENCVRGIYGE